MDSIEHNELRVRQGEHKNDSEKKKKKKKKKKKRPERGTSAKPENPVTSEYLQQTRPFSRKHNNDAPQRGERYSSKCTVNVMDLKATP